MRNSRISMTKVVENRGLLTSRRVYSSSTAPGSSSLQASPIKRASPSGCAFYKQQRIKCHAQGWKWGNGQETLTHGIDIVHGYILVLLIFTLSLFNAIRLGTPMYSLRPRANGHICLTSAWSWPRLELKVLHLMDSTQWCENVVYWRGQTPWGSMSCT
jgi:hypothetical protein